LDSLVVLLGDSCAWALHLGALLELPPHGFLDSDSKDFNQSVILYPSVIFDTVED
ncbi:hypothetical protein STEG23_002692, partial [Scotinomys teguina]